MTLAAMDLDKAELDPDSVFPAPKDVLGAPGLSPEEKKSILVRWEADLEALLRATEEGMPLADQRRSPAELLRAVHEAMQLLDRDTSSARCCC